MALVIQASALALSSWARIGQWLSAKLPLGKFQVPTQQLCRASLGSSAPEKLPKAEVKGFLLSMTCAWSSETK